MLLSGAAEAAHQMQAAQVLGSQCTHGITTLQPLLTRHRQAVVCRLVQLLQQQLRRLQEAHQPGYQDTGGAPLRLLALLLLDCWEHPQPGWQPATEAVAVLAAWIRHSQEPEGGSAEAAAVRVLNSRREAWEALAELAAAASTHQQVGGRRGRPPGARRSPSALRCWACDYVPVCRLGMGALEHACRATAA